MTPAARIFSVRPERSLRVLLGHTTAAHSREAFRRAERWGRDTLVINDSRLGRVILTNTRAWLRDFPDAQYITLDTKD